MNLYRNYRSQSRLLLMTISALHYRLKRVSFMPCGSDFQGLSRAKRQKEHALLDISKTS